MACDVHFFFDALRGAGCARGAADFGKATIRPIAARTLPAGLISFNQMCGHGCDTSGTIACNPIGEGQAPLFGRARLPPSRSSLDKMRLGRSLVLPFSPHAISSGACL